MTSSKHSRGYALLIVMLVLALMSVGLGTLLYFLEASAQTTSSMLERRRVFYACDGIGRAATVLAQRYMTTQVPTTPSLIKAVCDEAGGGCCASATGAIGACDNGTPPASTSRKTAFGADPNGPGASALPFIVPPGFKVKEFQIASLAPSCTTDTDCVSGTCVKEGSSATGNCRTVAPLPNGPFQGMNARQDVIAIALRAEHTATTQFACKTRQTITLGKIAMFQFFLFSDSQYTDWHPGPVMRATGRMHANGDLAIEKGAPVYIERVTASGDIRCMNGTGMVTGVCSPDKARIAKKLNPNMFDDNDFNFFKRTDTSWTNDALNDYGNGNAQDKAHGVPRLQLPVIGSPSVQRGFDANNSPIDNANVVGGLKVNNSRLLVDPVNAGDSSDVKAQKFAAKADIRILNGVWYLRDPANANNWPGIPIWSDHGVYKRTTANDFVTDSSGGVGQRDLQAAGPQATLGWASRVPRRYSYYSMNLLDDQLQFDVDGTTMPRALRAVVSYGALFRDESAGRAAAVWRPGVRTLRTRTVDAGASTRESWCEDGENTQPVFAAMIDALALDDAATTACTQAPSGTGTLGTAYSRGSGLLAATRSGFRDGFAEHEDCDINDRNGSCATRQKANVLPLNFDLNALQDALADTTGGELGSFFCAPGTPSCSRLMGAPFNGIVYIGAPYAGSENGYGTNGGIAQPTRPPAPTVDDAATSGADLALNAAVGADGASDTDGAADWTSTTRLPILRDDVGIKSTDRGGTRGSNTRDDEANALPFPLCSDDAGADNAASVNTGDANTDMTRRGYVYRRPLCSGATTRITGVRIINGRRVNSNTAPLTAAVVSEAGAIPAFPSQPTLLNPGMLPNGISVISNLPVYVVGDVNVSSDAFSTDPTRPWVPVLIGGDVVHLLSNDWDDRKSRWAVSAAASVLFDGKINTQINAGTTVAQNNGVVPRRATVTRWYIEMLSGWGMTVSGAASGGIHNFPRFLEHWGSGNTADCGGSSNFTGGCPAIILGSLVIGHNRVYTQWRFIDDDDAGGAMGRSPPRRDWGFDRHLEDLVKQPPGAPVFDVAAIQQWTRN